ncbi:GNAT family N-acetyltransferase [Hufsiella ginkgonis]|uniref:GNAT family N-acetyltransferase n=1 Tax=Hufsiella ginkgonis TaxID=2695274 RepID=A0A7K1XVF8_9SPHI|nr:GNAT family N-acetyltransferase [Hufsiella ginkgonis]MXV14962.1 GNAT family N-acetyltransferase [Hufsiella ginkgonis]
MIRIRPATLSDVPVIHRLAAEIWPATYRQLMPAEQLRFMLENMYSEDALTAQFDEITFLIGERDGQPVAFAGCSLTEPEVYKLHKIYLLPSEQGKGSGKALIGHIEDLARSAGAKILELNVKRDNPARGFYRKLGFEIYQTVDIAYYQFELNDYVMRKPIADD